MAITYKQQIYEIGLGYSAFAHVTFSQLRSHFQPIIIIFEYSIAFDHPIAFDTPTQGDPKCVDYPTVVSFSWRFLRDLTKSKLIWY